MLAVIYVRTSTVEQHPENQIQDCQRYCESRGYEVQEIHIEKLSGFKDINRPEYEKIKKKAYRGEIRAVVVWALDRWVRNRDTLLEDVTSLSQYGCKIHSVKEEWLEAVNIEGPLGRTVREFLLGLVGSIAEMESQRKSERTKIAFLNRKGKRWGRRSLPKRVYDEVIEHRKNGKNLRWIMENVYYYDKNRNKKNLSLGVVHKIISEKGGEILTSD